MSQCLHGTLPFNLSYILCCNHLWPTIYLIWIVIHINCWHFLVTCLTFFFFFWIPFIVPLGPSPMLDTIQTCSAVQTEGTRCQSEQWSMLDFHTCMASHYMLKAALSSSTIIQRWHFVAFLSFSILPLHFPIRQYMTFCMIVLNLHPVTLNIGCITISTPLWSNF